MESLLQGGNVKTRGKGELGCGEVRIVVNRWWKVVL